MAKKNRAKKLKDEELVHSNLYHLAQPIYDDVYSKIDSIYGLADGVTPSQALSYQMAILKSLWKKCRKSEQKFYADIGVSGLVELQEKFTAIENSGLNLLRAHDDENTKFVAQILKDYNIAIQSSSVLYVNIDTALNDVIRQRQVMAPIAEFIIDDVITDKLGFINSFMEDKHQFKPQDQIRGNHSRRSLYGIEGRIKSISRVGDKIHIEWREDGLDNSLARRFNNALEARLNAGQQQPVSGQTKNGAKDLRQYIADKVCEYIAARGGDVALQDIVRAESTKVQNYALSNNESSIIGYLGELLLNVELRYLLKGSPLADQVMNVGNLKDKTGRDFGIDTIFKAFNFQVKNYQMPDGQFDFHNDISLGALFDRTDGANPTLSEIMKSFYGVLAFNKPFSYGKGDAYDNYLQKYTLHQAFEPIITKKYFSTVIDKIIRIDQKFSTNESLFAKETVYFNTFFKFGADSTGQSLIVPSSDMLQAIMESLDNKANTLQFDIDIQYDNTQTLETITAQNKSIKKSGLTRDNILKDVRANYRGTLNIAEIMNRAIARAKRLAQSGSKI